ncbi:hypothetical protein P692DRAFT_20870343 [Suillus brevipes Sb2]|nr:hypothetical protein P692DRAFT_20870343 [Suillus brevipes Sb2]
MAVPRSVMKSYFATYEPDLVRQRKARRLRRKRFWAACVNDLFAVDQHDKWLRFGLALHTGIEPFSLILSYYLDTLMELGYMPLVTQRDTPTPLDADQKNVMPEITWSQLRRRFTPGFENVLDTGVSEGWYDATNTLQIMVFRWVFIPWLQMELNAYKDRINNTSKRCDRNKVLPHGIPDMIYNSLEDFGALDFKSDAIDHIRRVYINPSHTVFDLVPLTLGHHLASCYTHLGCPVITRDSAWRVYLDMLNAIELNVSHHTQLDALLADDEPDIQHTDAASDDDFNGLIVWEFTDDEGDDSGDEW